MPEDNNIGQTIADVIGGALAGYASVETGQDFLGQYMGAIKERNKLNKRSHDQGLILRGHLARSESANEFLAQSFPDMPLEDSLELVSSFEPNQWATFESAMQGHIRKQGDIDTLWRTNAAAWMDQGIIPQGTDINITPTPEQYDEIAGRAARHKVGLEADTAAMKDISSEIQLMTNRILSADNVSLEAVIAGNMTNIEKLSLRAKQLGPEKASLFEQEVKNLLHLTGIQQTNVAGKDVAAQFKNGGYDAVPVLSQSPEGQAVLESAGLSGEYAKWNKLLPLLQSTDSRALAQDDKLSELQKMLLPDQQSWLDIRDQLNQRPDLMSKLSSVTTETLSSMGKRFESAESKERTLGEAKSLFGALGLEGIEPEVAENTDKWGNSTGGWYVTPRTWDAIEHQITAGKSREQLIDTYVNLKERAAHSNQGEIPIPASVLNGLEKVLGKQITAENLLEDPIETLSNVPSSEATNKLGKLFGRAMLFSAPGTSYPRPDRLAEVFSTTEERSELLARADADPTGYEYATAYGLGHLIKYDRLSNLSETDRQYFLDTGFSLDKQTLGNTTMDVLIPEYNSETNGTIEAERQALMAQVREVEGLSSLNLEQKELFRDQALKQLSLMNLLLDESKLKQARSTMNQWAKAIIKGGDEDYYEEQILDLVGKSSSAVVSQGNFPAGSKKTAEILADSDEGMEDKLHALIKLYNLAGAGMASDEDAIKERALVPTYMSKAFERLAMLDLHDGVFGTLPPAREIQKQLSRWAEDEAVAAPKTFWFSQQEESEATLHLFLQALAAGSI